VIAPIAPSSNTDPFADRPEHSVSDAVIVNYNAGALLARCVTALAVSPDIRQIVVSDNGSIDGSLEALRPGAAEDAEAAEDGDAARAPRRAARLTLQENRANLGFGRACNRGYGLTRSPFVLFINPDCIVSEHAVARLLSHLEAHPQTGMAGPLILNPDGSEQVGARRVTPTPGRAFARAFGLTRLSRAFPRLFPDFLLNEAPLPESPLAVDAISGACMLVRRAAVEQVGVFDEGYFMHCEDLDWCMRFRLAGWRIDFVPDAVVTHDKGFSSRSRPVFVEWHKHAGMVRYYRKFFRDRYPMWLGPLVTTAVWARFGVVATGHSARRLARRLWR
jgi:GT2 family glycosyltransferase